MKKFGYYFVKTFSTIITIALLLVCLFFGYMYYCSNIAKMTQPTLGPYRIYVVISPSMIPTLNVNDAAVVASTDPAKLDVGDIMTFYAFEAEAVVTHRIINKELTATGYEFKTKGDNNNVEDPWVTPQDRIIGKYLFRIPKLATFLDITKQRPYLILALVAIILLIQFLCGVGERKLKPVKAEAATEVVATTENAAVAAEDQLEFATETETNQQLPGIVVESWNNEKGSASDEKESSGNEDEE